MSPFGYSKHGQRESERKKQAYAASELARKQRAEVTHERLLDRTKAAMEAESAEIEASKARIAAMGVREQVAYFTSVGSAPPPPPLPEGMWLLRDEVRRRDDKRAADELARREKDAGIPGLEAEHDKALERVNAEMDAKISEAKKLCLQTEQRAREQADSEREQLGPRPTLTEVAT